jgi:hypothetical protein
MKNIDRWFILIGLLYGALRHLGRHQRALRSGAFCMPISISSAGRRWCCSDCFTAPFRLSPRTNWPRCISLSTISGQIVFLVGIPLAQAHQTVALAAGGSLLVLVGMLTFLANYYLNEFSKTA